MKYAQWTISRPEGSTPEPLIRSWRKGSIPMIRVSGLCFG
jgi:hypothetical protein